MPADKKNPAATADIRGGVAVLLVSGFLGSGKTTLVRHLLDDAIAKGVKVGIVTNEFGELGLDAALIGQGGQATVELEGGCVCCQLSDELLDTLQELRESVDPDRIIIETSGVALPYDTLVQLWREPVNSWLADDAALVVVDALQVYEQRDLDGTFEQQVSSADLLLLNKIDLVPGSALPAIEARLRAMEPDAPLLHASHCQVDPSVLFTPQPSQPADDQQAREQRRAPAHGTHDEHDHEHFASEVIGVADDSDLVQLEAELLKTSPLRVKGFVRVGGRVKLLQGVGSRLDVSDAAQGVDDKLVGRVVIIRRASDQSRDS
ncbi:MAG: GTP-binding protein [Proteobacteria bacterium]|nr:GTP-binding protein [Pseudomonadota bacterium]